MSGRWSSGRRSDPAAFAELYRRYLPRVHAFAYRRTGDVEAAEDITSAAFERALRNLGCVRAGGRAASAPWLFRIVANELVDHYRRTGRASSPRSLGGAAAGSRPTTRATRRTWSATAMPSPRLLAAMDRLSPRYQQALSLRYLAGPDAGRGRHRDGRLEGDAWRSSSTGRRGRCAASSSGGRGRERRRPPPPRGGRPARRAADPDPAFVDALEAAPSGRGGVQPAAAPTSAPAGRRRRPRRRRRRLAGAIGAPRRRRRRGRRRRSGRRARGPRPRPPPELAAPVNVEVALADGTILEDPDGLRPARGRRDRRWAPAAPRGSATRCCGPATSPHGARWASRDRAPRQARSASVRSDAGADASPTPARTPDAHPPADAPARRTPDADEPRRHARPTPATRGTPPPATRTPTPVRGHAAPPTAGRRRPRRARRPAILRPRLRARLCSTDGGSRSPGPRPSGPDAMCSIVTGVAGRGPGAGPRVSRVARPRRVRRAAASAAAVPRARTACSRCGSEVVALRARRVRAPTEQHRRRSPSRPRTTPGSGDDSPPASRRRRRRAHAGAPHRRRRPRRPSPSPDASSGT